MALDVEDAAARRGLTKSEYVRRAVEAALAADQEVAEAS